LLPLVFFGLGLAVLPQAGLKNDEVLFATPIFHLPAATVFDTPIFHWRLPLMLLTYLGALKSWLYFPILTLLRPSYLTVRLPVLIIGSLTVWLFIWLLERVGGRTVAWVGGLLLATDTMFLLTTCFDWGPVALQHLLSVAGLALVFKFASEGKPSALFWGFLCFGLALWDKALFLWLSSGLMVATIVVFPRELWSRCSLRNIGLAAAGLCLGALPLVAYNAASNLATFRANSSFDLAQLPSRLHALRITWDGEILWGYMVHAPWSPGTPRESGALGRVSGVVHSLAGIHYHNELEPAFWVALVLAAWLCFTPGFSRARKTLLFCLIASAVAWIQMAITKDAGWGAHHVVLLWPLPQWFLAVVFVEASRRLRWRRAGGVALAAAMVFLAGENLLLTNEYFYQLATYGALGSWSDAIYQLSGEVGRIQFTHLVVDDWGIANSLLALHGGGLPLVMADGREWDQARWAEAGWAEDVWIGHTPQYQQTAGVNERIVQAARSAGFEKQIIKTVPDRNGRPVFEIFRFVRVAASDSSRNWRTHPPELQDDFGEEERENPTSPGDRDSAVAGRLEMRGWAVVVQQPEGDEGKCDDVGAHHPFFVDLDAPFQNGVIRHASGCHPGDSQRNQRKAKGPSRAAGDADAKSADRTHRHATQKDPARPAMQARIARAEAGPELPGAGEQCHHAACDVHQQPAAHGPIVRRALVGVGKCRLVVVQIVTEHVLENEGNRNGQDRSRGEELHREV
jgi:hypothetical protein